MMEQFLAQKFRAHPDISPRGQAAATGLGCVYVPVLLLGMAPQSKP